MMVALCCLVVSVIDSENLSLSDWFESSILVVGLELLTLFDFPHKYFSLTILLDHTQAVGIRILHSGDSVDFTQ